MFKVLLGDVRDGRLQRLPYLGYSVLVVVLILGFGIAVAVIAGVGEQIIGGDIQAAQDRLREWFALPAMLLIMVVMVLFLFMSANLMAKRIRDIGWPGWWGVLGIVVLTGIVSSLISEEAGNGLHTLFWVLLLLIPGNIVAGGDGSTP